MRGILPQAAVVVLALAVSVLTVGNAMADEQLNTIASGGSWITVDHSLSLTDPPDVCLAMDQVSNFMIRHDANDIEFRLSNNNWSLPANITGTFELDVNGSKYPLAVNYNTSTMISSTASQDVLLSVIEDMRKTNSMDVTAGHAPSITVSLVGISPVLTSFLTCSGIQEPSNEEAAGSNPFSTNPTPQAQDQSSPAAPQATATQESAPTPQSPSPPPAPTPNQAALPPAVIAYAQGHADRVRLEQFVDALPASEKQGFVYWSSQRSLNDPGSCSVGAEAAFPNDPAKNSIFLKGCQEGQVQLAPVDIRRKSDPLYRAGWNAPVS
jgi:hypothetical protein